MLATSGRATATPGRRPGLEPDLRGRYRAIAGARRTDSVTEIGLPQSLEGRSLVSIVDELWSTHAFGRALDDARLRRWRALHVRRGRGNASFRFPSPPPSDDLLRAMLGAAWWTEFDALNLDPTPVATAIDPLHVYGANVRSKEARRRLIDEIGSLRSPVFASAVQPLITSISIGDVLVAAFKGVEHVQLPTPLLRHRRWKLTHDGALIIRLPDGGQEAFDQASCVDSNQHLSTRPARRPSRNANPGGRPRKYDWDDFAREIVRFANQPDGLQSHAVVKRHMLDWCARHFPEQPDVGTIDRYLKSYLPPELPPR